MSEYLFLGHIVPLEMEQEVSLKRKKSMQDAAIALQWNIIDGIEKNIDKSIDIYSLLPVDSYPHNYKESHIKTRYFSHAESAEDILVGHNNVHIIRRLFMRKCVNKYAAKWARKNPDAKAIFMYTINGTFINAALTIKKKLPQIKVCCIIADLPEFINLSKDISLPHRLYKKIRKLFNNEKKKQKKKEVIDNYVLLTKQMAERLKIKQPFVVVEGIATTLFPDKKIRESDGMKKILYAGTLHEKFGVKNLINAFLKMENDNYRLIVCGTGDSQEWIRQKSAEDKRIIYKGRVERKEVLRLMQEVDIIVNPRQAIGEFTKYSFPSKNIEALSAGTPLVAYKLDGIPDEYDDYIYYVGGNSVDDLKNKLIETCEKPLEELIEFGKSAKEFVVKNKNAVVQAKKILDIIE